MKLQELRGFYHLTIPKAIIEGMQWHKGEEIEITIKGRDEIILKRKITPLT